jgi:ABC-2 type transport system permease protein
MRSFLEMTKANLKMTMRNRQALFWNLVFPAIFIILFGAILGSDGESRITVGIAGEQSTLQQQTIAAMEANDEAFDARTGGTPEEELAELENGNRQIVLVFGAEPASGEPPFVQLYYDDTTGPASEIQTSAVKQLLMVVALQESPVEITEQPVATDGISYIDFLVPGIVGMAIMNTGIIGLSTSFVNYRERGILRRIKVTPFALSSFILSKIVAQLVVAVSQAVILVGLGLLLFDLNLHGAPFLTLIVILTGGLAFLAIGFALSGLAKNAEAAASYANLITFPMLFLSGVFFPLDSAPGWLQPITRVMPLRYLVDALRNVMTRGRGLESIWLDLLFLAVTFVIGMVIAVRFFRWDSKNV